MDTGGHGSVLHIHRKAQPFEPFAVILFNSRKEITH